MDNHQLFVGRNDHGNGFAVGSGNHAYVAEAGFQVGFLVDVQTEEAQVADHAFADDVGVFADAADKDQCVQTACGNRHTADVFGKAIDKHIQGQSRAFMPLGGFFFNGAAVVDRPEMPSRPDFLFSISVISGDGHIGVFGEKAEYGRIDVAAARTHYQPFPAGQAHTGVARFAVGDGGNGALPPK